MKRPLHTGKLGQNRCRLGNLVLQERILPEHDLYLPVVIIQGDIPITVKYYFIRVNVKFTDQPAQSLNGRKNTFIRNRNRFSDSQLLIRQANDSGDIR